MRFHLGGFIIDGNHTPSLKHTEKYGHLHLTGRDLSPSFHRDQSDFDSSSLGKNILISFFEWMNRYIIQIENLHLSFLLFPTVGSFVMDHSSFFLSTITLNQYRANENAAKKIIEIQYGITPSETSKELRNACTL